MKNYKKNGDELIETYFEEKTKTYSKTILLKQKEDLEKNLAEVNTLLDEFEKVE